MRLLATTPTYTGGSWVCVEDIIKLLPSSVQVLTIGLGTGRKIGDAKIVGLPYYSFEKLNPNIGRNIFFNFLYQLPLQILNLFYFFIYRPNVVVSNGFGPIFVLLPFLRVFKVKSIVYYGSFLSDWFKHNLIKQFVSFVGTFIDHFFVNSVGSQDDLAFVIPNNKILVIEHWSDLKPTGDKSALKKELGFSQDALVVFSSGRLLPEKGIHLLLKVISELKQGSNIKFVIAGEGQLKDDVVQMSKSYPEIEYIGFVHDRQKLLKYYEAADIVWAIADETYLSKPAIEALALGTPIMVPDIAGVLEKYYQNIKINSDLVPQKVGWLVDGQNASSAANLLSNLAKDKSQASAKFYDCIEYSSKKYSVDNVLKGIEVICT